MSFFGLYLLAFQLLGSRLEMLKSFDDPIVESGIRNIDAIFVINLDIRPERLEYMERQFKPYDLKFNRFSAVYGLGLPASYLSKAGMIYHSNMERNHWATVLDDSYPKARNLIFLGPEHDGLPVFSQFTSKGMIANFLSHLCVLKGAYEKGLETIWVLEDDAKVVSNPFVLEYLIEDLNKNQETIDWDILYTDLDTIDQKFYYEKSDFFHGLRGLDLNRGWRPDILPSKDKLHYRKKIDANFIKIGSRFRTHSLLYKRSGMKKILDFFEQHGMFAAIDHDLHVIPDLQKYNLTFDLVTFEDNGLGSDTGVK